MKKEIRIKNRKGKIIYAVIEWNSKSPGPLVVLCHGYRSFGGTPQVAKVAYALRQAGYTTVCLDATNSTGKSSGKLVDFTVGGYVQDIKKVVSYALKYLNQKEYILIGYSIGGMAACIIASRDNRMSKLVLQGPTYNLPFEFENKTSFKQLLQNGWADEYSIILRRKVRIGISVYQEGKKYNMPEYVRRINCKTLVVYGSNEEYRQRKSYRSLFNNLKVKKRLMIIKDAGHTFPKSKDAKKISGIIIKWLHYN